MKPKFPQPADPSVIVAREGIDDAMIVTAGEGIDDAMIVTAGEGIDDAMLFNPAQKLACPPKSGPVLMEIV